MKLTPDFSKVKLAAKDKEIKKGEVSVRDLSALPPLLAQVVQKRVFNLGRVPFKPGVLKVEWKQKRKPPAGPSMVITYQEDRAPNQNITHTYNSLLDPFNTPNFSELYQEFQSWLHSNMKPPEQDYRPNETIPEDFYS
jgi:hypothetical protein